MVEPLESRRLLAATVTISATPSDPEGYMITVTFHLSVVDGQATTYTVGCNIAGEATVDLDYIGPAWRSAEITMPQGSGMGAASVTVHTLRDNLAEGTEVMEFVLFTGGAGWTPGEENRDGRPFRLPHMHHRSSAACSGGEKTGGRKQGRPQSGSARGL